VLRGAHGDPRRERRDRLVADVLVDESDASQSGDVDVAVEAEAGERLASASPETRCSVSAIG
jgi:hypothetical protein